MAAIKSVSIKDADHKKRYGITKSAINNDE